MCPDRATDRPSIGTAFLSVVVPVYNEEENLETLDSEIQAAVSETCHAAEIIYVDDCSTDRSREVLRDLARQADRKVRARVITLRRNFGQTAALAAGFDLAQGDLIVTLDSDLQNDPADIPRLLEKVDEGFDVVSGWRRNREDALWSRTVPSRAANWLISRISGTRLHDTGCTLKVYRSALLREIRLYGEMHRFLPAFLAQVGARITEVEVRHRPRVAGQSKYGGKRLFKVLVDLTHLYFMSRYYARPMHFFGQLALFFGLAAVVTSFVMVALKYGWLALIGLDYRASFVQTPLPAVAATFLLGSVLSTFFGILGEILIRVHHEATGRRGYSIARVEEPDAGADP